MKRKSAEELIEELGRRAIEAVIKLGEVGKTLHPELAEQELQEILRVVNRYLLEARVERRKRSNGFRPPL